MRVPKKFALSTMLMLMLLVAAVFGFLAYRKNSLNREVAAINRLYGEISPAQGVIVKLNESWLWPVLVRKEATVVFKQDADGNLYVKDTPTSTAIVRAEYEKMKQRLVAIGIQTVDVMVDETVFYQGKSSPKNHWFHSDEDFHRHLQWRCNQVPQVIANN